MERDCSLSTIEREMDIWQKAAMDVAFETSFEEARCAVNEDFRSSEVAMMVHKLLDEKRERIIQMKELLKSHEKDRSELFKMSMNLRERDELILELQGKIDELRRKRQNHQSVVEGKVEKEVQKLCELLKEEEAENDLLRTALEKEVNFAREESDTTIGQLSFRNSELEVECKALSQKVMKTSFAFEMKQNEVESLKNELRALMRSNKEEGSRNNEAHKMRLKKRDDEIQQLKEKIKEFETGAKIKLEEHPGTNRLLEENKLLKIALKDFKAKLREKEESIEELTTLRNENSALRAELKTSDSKLQDKREIINQLRGHLEHQERVVEELDFANAEVPRDVLELRENLDFAFKQLAKERETVARLRAERNDLLKQHSQEHENLEIESKDLGP